jgi:hypothetical protein
MPETEPNTVAKEKLEIKPKTEEVPVAQPVKDDPHPFRPEKKSFSTKLKGFFKKKNKE